MFDARLRPLIDPPLNWLAAKLALVGITANMVTLAGLAVGLGAGWALVQGDHLLALALIVANRLLDGIDGAVARVHGPSDFGGYLDSLCDFGFYVAVPLGFGFADPANLPAATLLIASFTLTAVGFLAFAAIAAKRGLETAAQGQKSFFYAAGLAEGGETIAVFILMCLMPHWFAPIALGFAALCLATVLQRLWLARRIF